jgi:cytochrome c oxidase assembly protein subunit 11
MKASSPRAPLSLERRNLRVGLIAGATALAMVGASFAAVPLYAAFCRATGFAGTTQVAHVAPAARGARELTVSFDANVAPGLSWTFEPETASVRLRTGATTTVFFRVHNLEPHETGAVAVFNVTPEVSGAWFDKISCFCFSEQHLGPNETAELPVVFFLDPHLEQDHTMDDVGAITLSYTLFAAKDDGKDAAKPVALAPPSNTAPPRL